MTRPMSASFGTPPTKMRLEGLMSRWISPRVVKVGQDQVECDAQSEAFVHRQPATLEQDLG